MRLTIEIGEDGLEAIQGAGQAVTLVRHVYSLVESAATATLMRPADALCQGAATASLAVAWQTFAPVSDDVVAWGERFHCFATTTPLALGAVIVINSLSAQAVPPGVSFVFGEGCFSQQSTGGSSYAIHNTTQSMLAFGLAQSMTRNGGSPGGVFPLCAFEVLPGEWVYLQPKETCDVFLSSGQGCGELLEEPSTALSIIGRTDARIGFSDATSQFYLLG